jgi:hypothetical protein
MFKNQSIVFFFILFLLSATPSFAQFPDQPSDTTDPLPPAPINDYIYVLSFMGLGLGVFKIQEQKNK